MSVMLGTGIIHTRSHRSLVVMKTHFCEYEITLGSKAQNALNRNYLFLFFGQYWSYLRLYWTSVMAHLEIYILRTVLRPCIKSPFSVMQQSKSGLDRLIVEVYRLHTVRHTHISDRTSLNKWLASRTDRYLHDTKHTQQTNIYATVGIRNLDRSYIQTAADLHLRSHVGGKQWNSISAPDTSQTILAPTTGDTVQHTAPNNRKSSTDKDIWTHHNTY